DLPAVNAHGPSLEVDLNIAERHEREGRDRQLRALRALLLAHPVTSTSVPRHSTYSRSKWATPSRRSSRALASSIGSGGSMTTRPPRLGLATEIRYSGSRSAVMRLASSASAAVTVMWWMRCGLSRRMYWSRYLNRSGMLSFRGVGAGSGFLRPKPAPIRLPAALTEPGPGGRAVQETEHGDGGKRPRAVLRLLDGPIGCHDGEAQMIVAVGRLGMGAALAAGLAAHQRDRLWCRAARTH